MGPPAPKLEPRQRWVFSFTNFANEAAVPKLTALMKRAHQAGYTGILVADSKFEKFQLQPPAVTARLRKFREDCTAEKMKFIAAVTPFGYADTFLTNDPNLCEGMPVRNAVFVVKDGKLVPGDDKPLLVNPSFEEFKNDNPKGWYADSPGVVSFADEQVKFEGKSSLRQQDPGGKRPNARVSQKIQVKPWQYYHVSVMVKTEDWTGKDMRVMGFAGDPDGGMPLNWQAPDLKKTMDWTRFHFSFCSLDNTEVTLYMGCWDAKTGKIWWDDVKIEPGGFVNVIRRDSLPLTITSEDGKTTYEEGKDFSAVKDPKLFLDPNPGYFTIWHDVPVVPVMEGGRLKEGQKVLASYHFATAAGKGNNFNMCMAEPKVYEIVEKHIQWMKEYGNPDIYLMAHDEIRIGGWDDSCVKSGKTPGQLLADNVRKCTEIIKRVDPGKPILVWNDMFDPFHNARPDAKHFYLVKGRGPWAGSWEGLSSDVGVANWMQNKLDSLKFFSDRGHQQILAGYYDADPKKIVDWLDTSKQAKNVVGVMYTTWAADYSNLEKFIEYANKWEAENAGK
ncbi:MAG: hypothetical protein ABSE73_18440 [Planctomycetota bacterium]